MPETISHAVVEIGESARKPYLQKRLQPVPEAFRNGLVVDGTSAPEAALSKTLLQLRPWSLMVVIADPDDYIDNMLVALRAETNRAPAHLIAEISRGDELPLLMYCSV